MANTTETLRQIIKVDGIDKASKDVNQLKGSIDNSNQSLINMGLRFVSVGVAVKTLTDSYKAFIVQRDAVNKVELAINNMGLQSSITTEAVKDIASELQSLTNYGDEETLGKIFQPLILAGVDSVDTMKSIGMTILDIADGTGRGIESVSTQITGLISGASDRVTELARAAGISQEVFKKALEGTNTATERAIALQEVLGGKFEGMAEKSVNPLKQLENTIGDVKEELGRAFYPLIKTLADSAKSFLENKKNVDSLITTTKTLVASFAGLQAIKFSGNLVSQFKNVGKELSVLDNNLLKLSKIKTKIIPIELNIEKLEKDINTVETSITRLGDFDASLKKMNASGGFVDKGLPKIYNKTSLEASKLAEEQQKLILKNKELSAQFYNVGESALSSSASFVKAGLSLLGWVGVAYSVFTIVKQLGKAFGWWGKSIKDTTDKLEEQKKKELDRRQVFKDSLTTAKDLLEINNRTVAENKELSTILDALKTDYGIVVGLEEDRGKALKIINEELDTQKSFNSVETTKKRMLEEKKALEQQVEASKTIISQYKDVEIYAQSTGDAIKGWFLGASGIKSLTKQGSIIVANKKIIEDSLAEIEELDNQINNLGKGNNFSDSKDKGLSALSKYYEMVKFSDSSYYNWKKTQIETSTDEWIDSLDKSLYEEEDIIKMRSSMNAKQIEDLKKQRDDYYNSQQASLTKSLSALSTYYEMVKFSDKGYYDWRIKSNKEESDRYVQQLIDSGYTLLEAQEEGKKLEIELNKKTNQEKLNWETLYHTTVQNLSKSTHEQALDNIAREVNSMEALTDAEKQHLIILKQTQYFQDQQKSTLASYYDTVKSLDSGYYDYKKQLIEDDIKTQLEADLLTQDQATLLQEKRIENLKMESEAYQNHYAIVNAGIQGAMGSMLEFAKVTAKSNNDIAKAWYALADAVIAELKRMVTQMIVNYAWQKILGFMPGGIANIFSGGTSNAVTNFGGNGIGLNTPGVGFLSTPTSPIGSGSSNMTPIINTNRSNDNTIVNKLNEVINAINNNSLRTQIRTIDRIELAQEVEAGNLQRSVK